MAKKLSLLLAAVAVVALAVPAFASAAAAVTVGGKLAAVGTKLTATSTDVTVETVLGKFTCAKATAEAELTKNTGSEFEAEGLGEGTTSTCKLGEKTVTFTDFTLKHYLSTVTGSGSVELTFKVDVSPTLTCHYQSFSAPFTYVTGTDVIKFTNATVVGSPLPCGDAAFSAEFTVSSPGGAVILE